jgi:hypothetical protein
MALNVKVGSFALPTTNNATFAVTGVGFQPKVVLFWSIARTADAVNSGTGADPHIVQTILGMYDGTTSVCANNLDDFAGGDPGVFLTKCIVDQDRAHNGVTASGVSLDSDGFTLNVGWTGTGAANIVCYMALGGSDLSAKIISQNITATGNKAFTGAGFRPSSAILIGGVYDQVNSNSPGLGYDVSIGAVSSTSQRWFWSSCFSGGTALNQYARVDKCVGVTGNSGATVAVLFQGDIVSFDSDGLTINFDTWAGPSTTNGATGNTVYALCLAGINTFAGSLAQKTSTGSQSVTGVGFQPSAILFGSAGKTAGTTIVSGNQIYHFTGGTDGTNSSVTAVSDNNTANTILDRTKCLAYIADGVISSAAALASFTSMDTDGFTVNWTAADATARQNLFFAIGAVGAAAPAVGTTFQPHRMPIGC